MCWSECRGLTQHVKANPHPTATPLHCLMVILTEHNKGYEQPMVMDGGGIRKRPRRWRCQTIHDDDPRKDLQIVGSVQPQSPLETHTHTYNTTTPGLLVTQQPPEKTPESCQRTKVVIKTPRRNIFLNIHEKRKPLKKMIDWFTHRSILWCWGLSMREM